LSVGHLPLRWAFKSKKNILVRQAIRPLQRKRSAQK
jgi:hypothetical protein